MSPHQTLSQSLAAYYNEKMKTILIDVLVMRSCKPVCIEGTTQNQQFEKCNGIFDIIELSNAKKKQPAET